MTTETRVGIVGAGQLARMMGDESPTLGLHLTVLATSHDDSAIPTVEGVIIGSPTNANDLRALAAETDVITFDHELVDLAVLTALETEGVTFRPSPHSLAFSVNKATQRTRFAAAGLPVPCFLVVNAATDDGIADFVAQLGTLPVVKAATGGYDGRGVLFPATLDELRAMIATLATTGPVVVEERVDLQAEVAQMVARGVDGDIALYPVVTTVQADGMCNEVQFPTSLSSSLIDEASHLTREIATLIDLVGVMAVEYFVTPHGLVINELALRPHNSGHWTIEGCQTSQFANHLLAVAGRPVGDPSPVVPSAVMVNVVGADAPGSVQRATEVPGAHVHDYGKAWRPQRKLGHVTVVGDDLSAIRQTAWASAHAYGTSTKEQV